MVGKDGFFQRGDLLLVGFGELGEAGLVLLLVLGNKIVVVLCQVTGLLSVLFVELGDSLAKLVDRVLVLGLFSHQGLEMAFSLQQLLMQLLFLLR